MNTKLVVKVLGRQTTQKIRSMPNRNDWDPEAEGLGEPLELAFTLARVQATRRSGGRRQGQSRAHTQGNGW